MQLSQFFDPLHLGYEIDPEILSSPKLSMLRYVL
jgi:hypothetical protein